MEAAGCEIIGCAPPTLRVKGQINRQTDRQTNGYIIMCHNNLWDGICFIFIAATVFYVIVVFSLLGDFFFLQRRFFYTNVPKI